MRGEIVLLFMDAAHFVHSVCLSKVWCERRISVKSNSGRQRLNVLGVVDAITKEVTTVMNTTNVNAETIVEFFKILRIKYESKKLSIVLDNAKYQHCYYTKIAANMFNIDLIYLPSYSPNLNLIERLWKCVRSICLNSKYYEKFNDFCKSIETCCKEFNHSYKEKLKSVLKLSFQTFKNN